jgi:hypothetical protein
MTQSNFRGMISELWLLWTVIHTVVALFIAAGYCQANPVSEARLNPFMTEDDVITLMYRWKIGVRSTVTIKGVNPCPCVTVVGMLPMYYLGVDFGNPHWAKLPDGNWYRLDSDGFVGMGMGRTLEAAIKNAAYSGNLPQAERDMILRSVKPLPAQKPVVDNWLEKWKARK